jgi:hypothetical protein
MDGDVVVTKTHVSASSTAKFILRVDLLCLQNSLMAVNYPGGQDDPCRHESCHERDVEGSRGNARVHLQLFIDRL